MNFNRKICITGAAGFIGKELIKKLNNLGYFNLVLVDSKKCYDSRLYLGGYGTSVSGLRFEEFYDYNKYLKEEEFDFLQDVDFVFHLGAITDTRVKMADLFENNVLFTEKL